VSLKLPELPKGAPPVPQVDWDCTPASVRRIVIFLVERLNGLDARVAVLEEQLHTNSTNSSKPPSSDPPNVHRLPVKPKSLRRRPGGQPGHRGTMRPLLPLEKVDHLQELKPARCRRCDRPLRGTDDSPWRHQVTELPAVQPVVTEYRCQQLVCSQCGETTRAELPPGVTLSAFGPRLTATIALHTGIYRLSRRETERLFQDQFGIELSLGAVSACEERVSEAVAKPVEEVRAFVQRQPEANVDETGWWEKHKRAWLWTMVTQTATVFLISKNRNAAAARKLLGSFSGILCTDRWIVYNFWDTARRQLCWAHLLRDFIKISQRAGDSGALGGALVQATKKMFRWWHKLRAGHLDREAFIQRMGPLRRKVERLLDQATRCSDAKTRGTAAEIRLLKNALWTFVDHEGIEPTNNAAERKIRPGVLWRKGSFGSNGAGGCRFAERMLTCAATLRQQDRSVIEFMTSCVDAHWRGAPLPSLLPEATSHQNPKLKTV
jgi:transposase